MLASIDLFLSLRPSQSANECIFNLTLNKFTILSSMADLRARCKLETVIVEVEKLKVIVLKQKTKLLRKFDAFRHQFGYRSIFHPLRPMTSDGDLDEVRRLLTE